MGSRLSTSRHRPPCSRFERSEPCRPNRGLRKIIAELQNVPLSGTCSLCSAWTIRMDITVESGAAGPLGVIDRASRKSLLAATRRSSCSQKGLMYERYGTSRYKSRFPNRAGVRSRRSAGSPRRQCTSRPLYGTWRQISYGTMPGSTIGTIKRGCHITAILLKRFGSVPTRGRGCPEGRQSKPSGVAVNIRGQSRRAKTLSSGSGLGWESWLFSCCSPPISSPYAWPSRCFPLLLRHCTASCGVMGQTTLKVQSFRGVGPWGSGAMPFAGDRAERSRHEGPRQQWPRSRAPAADSDQSADHLAMIAGMIPMGGRRGEPDIALSPGGLVG